MNGDVHQVFPFHNFLAAMENYLLQNNRVSRIFHLLSRPYFHIKFLLVHVIWIMAFLLVNWVMTWYNLARIHCSWSNNRVGDIYMEISARIMLTVWIVLVHQLVTESVDRSSRNLILSCLGCVPAHPERLYYQMASSMEVLSFLCFILSFKCVFMM